MNQLPGLSPISLIALSLALGTGIVTFIPISISGGEAIKSSDWIGFAGSIVSGAMTLFAAAIAWVAVQKQIAANEAAEIRREKNAKNRILETQQTAKRVAIVAIEDAISAAAAVLHAVRKAERSVGPVEEKKWDTTVEESRDMLEEVLQHFSLRDIAVDLSPSDRMAYLAMLVRFSALSIFIKRRPSLFTRDVFYSYVIRESEDLRALIEVFDEKLSSDFIRNSTV